MIGLALFLAASTSGLVEAERDFAALAQRVGQWTAFRATAAPAAVIFVPDPVDATEWLKDRTDPPQAVRWQPAAAFLSCDGRTGATIGPWQRTSSIGYFVTVWERSNKQWRWTVDFGEMLKEPMPVPKRTIEPRRASCAAVPSQSAPPLPAGGQQSARGGSPDRSLMWAWTVTDRERKIVVYLWNGKTFDTVIERSSAKSTGPDGA